MSISEATINLLDELAEDVMLTEPDAVKELTAVHAKFQKFSESLPAEIPMNAKELVKACCGKLEEVLFKGSPTGNLMDALSLALAALQPVVR